MSITRQTTTGILEFSSETYRFQKKRALPTNELNLKAPLTIIVQVTRECNLNCIFCSESDFYQDPDFEQLMFFRDQLKGVSRIFLSGGEPLPRGDIIPLLEAYRERFPVLGLPTNGSYAIYGDRITCFEINVINN